MVYVDDNEVDLCAGSAEQLAELEGSAFAVGTRLVLTTVECGRAKSTPVEFTHYEETRPSCSCCDAAYRWYFKSV